MATSDILQRCKKSRLGFVLQTLQKLLQTLQKFAQEKVWTVRHGKHCRNLFIFYLYFWNYGGILAPPSHRLNVWIGLSPDVPRCLLKSPLMPARHLTKQCHPTPFVSVITSSMIDELWGQMNLIWSIWMTTHVTTHVVSWWRELEMLDSQLVIHESNQSFCGSTQAFHAVLQYISSNAALIFTTKKE